MLNNILLFIFGICFGSFVSAVSYRIPNSISFVRGRSICPKCKKQISWYDNIPLISFLLLRGKCRNCKKKISFRYFIIELVSGLGFVLIGFSYLNSIFYLVIFLILLTIFVIDLEHQIIPDSLIFTGILVVLVCSPTVLHASLFSALFSGFLGSSLLMILHLLTKGRGMGLGDVKFAILGGMLVNIRLLPVWLLLSFLTGAIIGCILILLGKAGMKSKIAFGPFLVLGIFLTVIFGESIMQFCGL